MNFMKCIERSWMEIGIFSNLWILFASAPIYTIKRLIAEKGFFMKFRISWQLLLSLFSEHISFLSQTNFIQKQAQVTKPGQDTYLNRDT